MGAFGKKTTARLPRYGMAVVTVSVRDANGFVTQFADIETEVGAVHEALAVLHLKSTEMEAAHRKAMGA